jgi:Peptidase MA superfamily
MTALACLAAAAIGSSAGATAPAQAETGISVVSSQAEVQFPTAVTFTLVAASAATITSVGLEVNTPEKAYGAIPLDVHPTFTAGNAVRAVWTWNSPGPGLLLPPGVNISYRWMLADATGAGQQTPWETVSYADSRYTWQEKSAPGVRLYWYGGGDAFGARLMQAAEDGLAKLREEQGVDLQANVSVYIYGNQRALRGAMLSSPTWIGGRAYPEFGTILLVIGQNELDEGRRSLVHELTHQLVYQQTFDPLLGSHVPLWLNEGLAVTSEGPTAPTFKSALAEALREDRAPSFRNLDGAFPSDPKASTVSYAQSESFVRYLLAMSGADGMRSLVRALQRGNRIDASLTQVYGSDLNQLQDAWRVSLGARPLSGSATPHAEAAVGARVAAAVASPAGLAMLLLLVLVGAVTTVLVGAIALLPRWKR